MILPGSEYLTRGLHAVAQSFLILDLTGLLVFLVFSLAELGSFTAELKYRRRYFSNPGLLLSKIRKSPGVQELPEPEKILATISLSEKEKALAEELLNLSLKPEEKKAVLQDFFNHIEQGFQKILEKTDLIAKVAPAFGLIGTLIPLGPGLAALGQGDIETLT
jgi:biopolymer transport protein ExbB/TolQ